MTRSTFGPVEIVALAFPEDHVPDGVQAAVRDVLDSGVVTLLDAVVVRRSGDEIEVVEVADLGDRFLLAQVELSGAGLAGGDDLEELGRDLPAGACAVVLVVEHVWARQVVAETAAASGVVVARRHVPAHVVNEVADLVLAAG